MNNVAILYSGSRAKGGIDTYIVNLFKYYDRSKINLTLLSLGNWSVVREIERQGGNVRVFSGKRVNPITIFRIARLLRREKMNLLVTGGFVADSYGRAGSLLSGVPHLSIIHSEFKHDYSNPVIRAIYGFLVLISRWKTKRYIVVSEYLEKILLKSGIHKKKINVIYNGVEIPKDNKRIDREGNKTIIGSIGRLHPVKNYQKLVMAAESFRDRAVVFKIWGEGAEKEKLQSIVNGQGGSNVVLSGFTNNIWESLGETDIYIQPSLSEGFGLTVVEAMMAGLPVIVSPRGSLLELVKDGETGIIMNGVEGDDIVEAINRLLNDKALAVKIAINGKKSAEERFNVKKWAEKTTNAFLDAAL